MKKNEGEVPQYYVENSHPAIVDTIDFDMVQEEIAYRQQLHYHSGSSQTGTQHTAALRDYRQRSGKATTACDRGGNYTRLPRGARRPHE